MGFRVAIVLILGLIIVPHRHNSSELNSSNILIFEHAFLL